MTSQMDRGNKLTLLLSKQRDYITAEVLAELMSTSTKTVYRLVKKINDEFPNGPLILSEKGRGYKLDYEKYIAQTNQTIVSSVEVLPSERQNNVMEELLLSSPKALKVIDLYQTYYVGDSAIANDEKIIAERISAYDLQLIRKNRTLAIEGKEENIRRAITELIQRLNIFDIDEIALSDEFDFNRYDANFVIEQIKLIEKKLNGTIPYPYNINIFSHLYIAVRRARKTNYQATGEKLTMEQLQVLDNESLIRDIAIEVIRQVEVYLKTKLPVSEIYYLYQYLLSSRTDNNQAKTQTFTEEVLEITSYYLYQVGEKLNLNVANEMIFTDLANHIKPLVNRLRHQIRVKNSLLDQIQLTYETIFNTVAEVSEQVSQTFQLPTITPDEIGFITLYFARMIETHQFPIQTLIMCTTGVGTSELLKVKLAKKFPELEIVDVISTKNYQSVLEKTPGIELILTTVGLKEAFPVQSLIVSAMLTADDQSRIQKKIEDIYHDR
ncbi:BglG family transcription antiterminator [Enterococcus sp. 1001283B150225_161107_E12]|uniref:BglG family transcription antiterminator n=1 Tax=Enterococcus sp. 1001283B150225_161107_E12 TaxID=2787145 RepID=UPI00189EC914|nr:PRD domain-containing protein [Enterococcus sp. 1001283B150225_161107_E12]